MFPLDSVLLLLQISFTYQFASQATDSPSILPRAVLKTEGTCPVTRTLFKIVWGCLSTTIICAWMAIHPNIPPREGPLKITLRRLKLMFWTILAPEILTFWAVNQRLAAKTVRDTYNKAKGYKEEKRGIWKTLKGWVSLSEITDAPNLAWTLKHGHFLIMGGIHLIEPAATIGVVADVEPRNTPSAEEDTEKGLLSASEPEPEEGRETILTLEMLRELVKDPELKIRLTEDDISHRSKGDAISKMIFMLQTSWFTLQCVARGINGLRYTQLELMTISLVMLNWITMICWWDKPLGAQAVMRIYLQRKLTDAERNVGRHQNSLSSHHKVWYSHTIHDIFQRQSQRNIFVDWLIRLPFALLLYPFISFVDTTIYLMRKLAYFPANATHVPTFYVPKHHSRSLHIFILLTLSAMLSVTYCFGWNFDFPTRVEQLLWRLATVAVLSPIATFPVSYVGAFIFTNVEVDTLALTSVICMLACARFVLLVLAILMMRQNQPPGVFVAVHWTQFYPRFL